MAAACQEGIEGRVVPADLGQGDLGQAWTTISRETFFFSFFRVGFLS